MARTWGYWTRAKLRILADYLVAFAIASKSQRERVYLDAFAGEGIGRDRLTGEQFEGSARIALEGPNPPFTRLCFFELARRATALERRLREEFPERAINVYPGDCNDSIPQALNDLRAVRWAPTFAFIDPFGMEFAWTTIEALAAHKRGYRRDSISKPEFKVEMWMLFPVPGLMRTLQLKGDVAERDARRATRLFGTDAWQAIHVLRRAGSLTGQEARNEYVNLMRWRLEHELGYKWTHPFEVKNARGSPLYSMILATDNRAGTKIMSDLYGRAATEFPKMREEILDYLSGQGRLFTTEGTLPKQAYRYENPHEPP